MKKIFLMAAVAMMSMVAVLVSCSSDKDGDDVVDATTPTVKITYQFSEDLLSLFDVTIKVTDFDGKTDNITPTASDDIQTKQYTTTKSDGTLTIAYSCKMKSSVAPVADKKFTFGEYCDATYALVAKGGGYSQSGAADITVGNHTGKGSISTQEELDFYKKRYEIEKEVTITLKSGKFVK